MIHRLYFFVSQHVITRQEIEKFCGGQGDSKESHLFDETIGFQEFKNQSESLYLKRQMEKFNYNLTQTAKALGLAPSNLSRKLKSLGLVV